ncbi:TPA: winged helix-turn-helix transcriptional regulator [Kluyvera ascorbata]|nr:winged helix-turn-helix transcriptional regulator [Kluyvera ascorbata]
MSDAISAGIINLYGINVVCTNTLLRLAARRLGHIYDHSLLPLELKATQVGLLSEIAKAQKSTPEGPTLQELSHSLSINMPAVSHAVKPLIKNDLIQLKIDNRDKRVKRCTLTEKGQKKTSQALQLIKDTNDHVEKILGHDEIEFLHSITAKIASENFLEKK